MVHLFTRLLWEETGVDLIEYAMLAGFLSLATYAMMTGIGSSIRSFFEEIHEYLETVQP